MSVHQKPRAKGLFADLVDTYSQDGLRSCETKETQVWRHASNQETVKRLALYHNYLPELANLHSSLSFYSICERHYNQIVASNHFYQHLVGPTQENKRIRSDPEEDNLIVHVNHSDLLVELEETKRLLQFTQQEGHQKSHFIADLNNQIVQMQTAFRRSENRNGELEEATTASI